MKLPPGKLDALLRSPDPGLRCILLYGPDGGAVRDHGDTLARRVAGAPDDPFRVTQLATAQVTADPARLADEVFALSMTGGRRVVRIRDAADGLAAPLDRILTADTDPDCLLLLEAEDLGPRSALRKLVEGAAAAMAVPCYLPEARDIARWAGETLAADGLRADPDALALLGEVLAGDRQLARREVEKLALYMPPETRVTTADIEAVVVDAGETSLDALAQAVAEGDLPAAAAAIDAVILGPGEAVGPLRVMQRHFLRLWQAVAAVDEGTAPEAAMAALRPPVFFKGKPSFRAQMRRWTRPALEEVLRRLVEAEAECKRTGRPAATIAADTLLRVTRMVARRRSAGGGISAPAGG